MEPNLNPTAAAISPLGILGAVRANPVKPAAKAAPKKAAAKPVKKVGTKNTGTVHNAVADGKMMVLKALCGECKVDPRIARRRLRAAKISPITRIDTNRPRDRWVFAAKDLKSIKAIITSDADKE